MCRGQADLVATVIMVSIALILALGLVYYFTPLVSSARSGQEVASLLSSISAGLSGGPVAYYYSGGEARVAVEVAYSGPMPATLFYAVLPVFNGSSIGGLWYSYKVYSMGGKAAGIAVASDPVDLGWSPLPGFNTSASSLFIATRSGYTPLSGLARLQGGVVLYSDYLEPGSVRVYLVRIVWREGSHAAGLPLRLAVFASVSGTFYEVLSLPLTSS